MNAVIYARTSKDDEQGEGHSIPQQIEECKTYCAKHGLRILETIQDANRSGRFFPSGFEAVQEMDFVTSEYVEKSQARFKCREGLARALKLMNAETVIVCREMTRVFRPLTGSLFSNWLPQQFIKNKSSVHTVIEGKVDFANFNEMFLHTITSMPVDAEVQKRARNSKYELIRLKDAGFLNAGPTMLGYRSCGVQKVAIVPDEAKIVRLIFALKLDGKSNLQIVKTLNKQKAKNKDWRIQEVLKVLDRPAYFGFQFNSKKELIQSKVFLPIVTEYTIEDWKRIQMMRAQQRKLRVRTGTKHRHVFSGLLKCGYCGCNLVITHAKSFGTNKTTFYYICPRSYQHDRAVEEIQGCRKARILENSVNDFFLFLDMHKIVLQGRLQKENSNVSKKVKSLKDDRDAIQIKINALFDSEGFSDSTIREQIRRQEVSVKEIDAKLAELSLLPTQSISFDENGECCGFEIKKDDNTAFFRSLINSIDVYFGKVSIKFRGCEAFDIERVPDRFSRKLPEVEIFLGEVIKMHKVAIQVLYKSYFYKSKRNNKTAKNKDLTIDKKGRLIFDSEWLTITALGSNPSYGKGRIERGVVLKRMPDYVLQNLPLPNKAN